MKTSTTFSILFWLKLSKAQNGKVPLYARVTVNGKRAEISLKRKIKIEFWNSAKNKVKGTNQEARIINAFLDQVSSELHKSKNELESEGKIISAQTIKARYLKEDEQNHSLLDLINKYKESPKAQANNTIFPRISNQKLNSYLKEIADLCQIRKNLTFHLARHTFATTVTLSNGVQIGTVSKLLGHSKIATIQIYAKG
jgi:hypothetical protein